MIIYRQATLDDAAALADAQVESFRTSYRGIYSDTYLDSPAFPKRCQTSWGRRLGTASEDIVVLVAEEKGELLGFLRLLLDESDEWGSCVDSLHVLPSAQRRGMARHLMSLASEEAHKQGTHSQIYLWCFAHNTAALAAYTALDGIRSDVTQPYPLPDGSEPPAYRFHWLLAHPHTSS